MKLGIDARMLVGQRTGIGNWTALLLQELPHYIPELTVFAYGPAPLTPTLPSTINDHFIRKSFSPPLMPGLFWLKLRAASLVRRDNLDVFWAARTLHPIGIERHTPVVSTVYDLNSVLYPGTMSIANLLAYKIWYRSDLQKADRVVAISHGTSGRLKDWMGRGADTIVSPGVADDFVPQARQKIEETMLNYGLSSPYLLFVGTLEPRKNLGNLLDALAVINSGRSAPLTLAIIGQRGWKNRKLFQRLDRGIAHVKELGFVPNGDLPALYSGATALMMPSLYEGYGMPAAEAAACGTWVVATDIPELREAAGDSGIYTEPSVDGIVSGIQRVLAATSAPARSSPVSWKDSAALLAQTLQEAAKCRRSRT